MNKEILEGNWDQISGKLKQKWGKLTDNDLTVIKGKRQEISGILQKHYGYTKEQLDKELDNFK